MITIKRLSSGYYRINGRGPCNWSQVPEWPCDEATIRSCTFSEASEVFIREVVASARDKTVDENGGPREH